MTSTGLTRPGGAGEDAPGEDAAADTRPDGGASADRLHRIWDRPPGWFGPAMAVNHKDVGRRFIYTSFFFLLLGGLLAMVMRTQLAEPEAEVVGPEVYNQLFTMHGTTMMFLFAVPMLEGLAIYLLPLMLGSRDMPYPRLGAFGYWAYLAGGLFVYASAFTGEVPDAGWFAYVPLSGPVASPGNNLDFWLLGVTFVEVAGIVGAIEIMVVVLKQRAPGMAIHRMPIFAWASLVMSVMMLFAFTVLAAASVLLELERKLGWPFYDPDRAGDPLLWQHLFWIFGHPEVYIMLIPAVGMVSMIVPTFARRPLAGYGYVAAALAAIGIASFGLWAHHMFTTGLPVLAMSFFTVASVLIAIPSGVQVFAWIATLWGRRPRMSVPLLFMMGFVFIFVLGGVTGVMVGVAPFDWQVHDTYFVVAHFHYVLIGGVVFPIFGALHHWLPKIWGRMLDERRGKVAFWLMFVGFNIGFFPQHVVGFEGMVRRTYTYREADGWDGYNLASTVGAFVMAIGVAVFTLNALHGRWRGRPAGENPWGAGTLEWATPSPPPPYNFHTPPAVDHREPLWDSRGEPTSALDLRRAMQDPQGDRRETIGTSVLEAEPQMVILLPGSSVWPLVVAVAATVMLAGTLVDLPAVWGPGAAGVVVGFLVWMWPSGAARELDDAPEIVGRAGAPAGSTATAAEPPGRLPMPPAPSQLPDVRGIGWWGTALGLVVAATALGALVFSYGYLQVNADEWPAAWLDLPSTSTWATVPVLLAVAALAATWALRSVRQANRVGTVAGLVGTAVAGAAAAVILGVDLVGRTETAGDHASEASTAVMTLFLIAVVAIGVVVSAFVAVRAIVLGEFTPRRHAAIDCVALLSWGLLVLGAVAAAVVWGAPRL